MTDRVTKIVDEKNLDGICDKELAKHMLDNNTQGVKHIRRTDNKSKDGDNPSTPHM